MILTQNQLDDLSADYCIQVRKEIEPILGDKTEQIMYRVADTIREAVQHANHATNMTPELDQAIDHLRKAVETYSGPHSGDTANNRAIVGIYMEDGQSALTLGDLRALLNAVSAE